MAGQPAKFGRLVRRHRVAGGLTQEELAELSGLSVRAISDIERGRTASPHRTSLARLAEALGLDTIAMAELSAACGQGASARGVDSAGGADSAGAADSAGGADGVLGLAHIPRQAPSGDPRSRPPQPGPVPDLPASADGTERPTVPRQLPAGVPHFVGRAAEIAALSGLLEHRNETPGTVVICAIAGTAGIGKTALALHWAHLVADDFPDGQLYVNLRGFDPSAQPVTPATAIRGFLDAVGVPHNRVPASPEAQAGLYRSLVADRRMLVILDNALDASQVRPLLPAGPQCLVLVTSRNQMADLVAAQSAYPLTLDLLAEAEAEDLLAQRLGTKRLVAENDIARQLTELCARLPLALSIAAARAATHPHFPLASLVSELHDTRRRLDALDLGEKTGSPRSVFSWSYHQLSEPAAHVFRMLGVHPGPDVTAQTAASLAGVSERQAREALAELHRASLVSEPVPGRFTFHDLLRAYAGELSASIDGEAEQDAALCRLLDHYLCAVSAAMDILHPADKEDRSRIPAPGTAAPALRDPAAARAWMDAEQANVIAATIYAADHRQTRQALLMGLTLSPYLQASAHCAEAVELHSHTCRAARDAGDHLAEATELTSLGNAEYLQGHNQDAARYHEQALALSRLVGDRAAEARALNSLGMEEYSLCYYQQAARHWRQSVALCREVGERHGLAISLSNLGLVEIKLGSCEQAAGHLREALEVSGQPGRGDGTALDVFARARALDSLGLVEFTMGRYQQAGEYLHQALDCLRQTRYRLGEVDTLDNLARVELALGRHAQASEYLQQALAITRETSLAPGEVQAVNTLGQVLLATGDPGQAMAQHERALALATQTGARYEQARAHDGIGHACQAAGNSDRAAEHWRKALAIYTAIGVPEARVVRAQLAASADAAQPAGAVG